MSMTEMLSIVTLFFELASNHSISMARGNILPKDSRQTDILGYR